MENQAIDRCHRIGQESKVNAYRLLMRDSVEEKIRVLQQQKSAMMTGVLGEEGFTRNLELEDLKFLFSQGPPSSPNPPWPCPEAPGARPGLPDLLKKALAQTGHRWHLSRPLTRK